MWLPTQYLQYLRWKLLAREAGPEVSRGDIYRGYWVGFTLGLITPGRVGQVGRALALHRCSLSRAIGLSAMERGYSALAMNGLGLLALVILPMLGWVPPFPLPGAVTKSLCVAGGSILLLLGVFPRTAFKPLAWLADRLPFREKLRKAVDVMTLTSPLRGTILLLLAIVAMFSALFQFVLLLWAMGSHVPVFGGMLTALLTFFLKGALPISIGSLGVGEWTAVYCFRGLGVEPSVAVAASLVLFTLNVFLPSLIGLPFIHRLRAVPWSKSSSGVGMSAALVFILVLGAISLGYGLVISGFVRGLLRLKKQHAAVPEAWPSVSVIVPARNEAEVLERTLHSLLGQDYPGEWEIVVVDDRSGDGTPQILKALTANHPRLRFITVTELHPRSPKKNALALGIRSSTAEVIVTTDADCEYHPGWLRALLMPMTDGVGVVAGMTVFDLPDGPVPFWQKLQWLDFVVQQFLAAGAIGAGIPASCNGSNLAYRRAVYNEIAGFGSSKAVVSGDDVLFAQRVSKLTMWRVVFATHSDSVVKSLPVQSVREMFHQRIRWASKGLTYRRSMLTFLFGIYAYYLMWCAVPLVMLLAPWTIPALTLIALWKLGWDYATTRLGCRMFHFESLLPYFLPFILFHTILSPVFGIAGLAVPYRWKDGWYRTATMPRTLRKGLRRWRRFRLKRRPAETTA